MQCNIDSRGKAVRLVTGAIVLLVGVVLVFAWAVRSGGALPWVVSGACLAAGAFMIFEARSGWCVLRAMGFRTPI